jgi:hypothetical protein
VRPVTSGRCIRLLVVSRIALLLGVGFLVEITGVSWNGFRSAGAEAGHVDIVWRAAFSACCVASSSLLIPQAMRVNLDPVLEGVAGCKRTSGWEVAGRRTLERRAGRGVGAFMECSGSTWRAERERGETGWVCALLGLFGEKET